MTDEETLKEIAGRLIGKVVIEHIGENPQQFGRFVVRHLTGPAETVVYGINMSVNEARLRAVVNAEIKNPGALIVGPPGYVAEL